MKQQGQVKNGDEQPTFDPDLDRWENEGGRLPSEHAIEQLSPVKVYCEMTLGSNSTATDTSFSGSCRKLVSWLGTHSGTDPNAANSKTLRVIDGASRLLAARRIALSNEMERIAILRSRKRISPAEQAASYETLIRALKIEQVEMARRLNYAQARSLKPFGRFPRK